MIKLLNAFSLNMVAETGVMSWKTLSVSDAASALKDGFESSVGHAPTAAVFSQQLGFPVAMNRTTVTLKPNENAVIGQYRGERLEEGATQLPEGATIQWFLVEVTE